MTPPSTLGAIRAAVSGEMAFASTNTPSKPAARTRSATVAACSGGQMEITTALRAASRVRRDHVDEPRGNGSVARLVAATRGRPEDLVAVADEGRAECRAHRTGVEHADRDH